MVLQQRLVSAGGRNGDMLNLAETWDGSNWTEVNDINTGRYGAGGVGTTTAGLILVEQPDSGGTSC